MAEQDKSLPGAASVESATTEDAPKTTEATDNGVLESIEVEEKDKEPQSTPAKEDAAAEDSDADGEDDIGIDTSGRPVSNRLYKALKGITDTLIDFKVKKSGEDYFPALLFKRVPNKRNLPDYYQIIKEPSAISTLKGKIQRKSYTGIPEFVRDFALVVHNAQVYNRPNSQPVRDVFQLEAVFRSELAKLVEQGLVKEEETVLPDLGVIPAATPEPDPVSEEDDEEGDEEEDEEDGDESDDGGRKRRKSRQSGGGRKRGEDDDDDEMRKRRGRPPKVDTPLEARIKSIIKSLRRPKDENGAPRLRHFERLPDKTEYPHYYQEIKEPIAMDTIKKNAKRKKYKSVDHFMKDIELMCKNAMAYNVDGSEIYQDAKALMDEARQFAEAEKAKPDTDYTLDDGRIPLSDGIEYKGQTWKIGDWIHIQNPNDVTKPIVAQIYRTWRDSEGQNWINACWYYRPDQTIHQFERHFYPAEVLKTGQYRDHHIEEVLDRCFVMFYTRYSRGRPRHLDPKTEIYVCEARYNEEKHKFNKIKTWASCLPDEVREKDYEMDLYDATRRIKKIPSPIKHLLKDDARGPGDVAQQYGSKNAPPIVGAVHRGARDDNQSPPPEPTPPPPPAPIATAVRPPSNSLQMDRMALQAQPVNMAQPRLPPQGIRPPLSTTPSMPYQTASPSPAPQLNRPSLYHQSSSGYQGPAPPTPVAQHTPYAAAQQVQRTPMYQGATVAQSYTSTTPTQPYQQRQTIQQVQAQAAAQHQQQQYQPAATQQIQSQYPNSTAYERGHEAYVLNDAANAAIPKEIRDRYPQDDEGRILFFTQPPLDMTHIVSARTDADNAKPLKHSKEYLDARSKREELIKQRKREAQESSVYANSTHASKRLKPGFFGEERDVDGRIRADPLKAAQLLREEEAQQFVQAKKYLENVSTHFARAQADEYRRRYGENAAHYLEEDAMRMMTRAIEDQQTRELAEQVKDTMTKDEKIAADTKRMLGQNFWTGRYLGTGRFEDDFDNRLPRPS